MARQNGNGEDEKKTPQRAGCFLSWRNGGKKGAKMCKAFQNNFFMLLEGQQDKR